MSFFKKISNSIPITVSQEPQAEVTSQSQPQPETSFGIAGSPDQFETAPDNFYFLEQQAQSASLIQPSKTRDLTVDASSVFSFFEPSVGQLDNRLPQLMDRLNSLTKKRNELGSQIEDKQKQQLKTQEALKGLNEALKSEQPIPDALVPLLGSLGILGMIGGLPALPVIGALGAMFGLNEGYKQKMKEMKHELEMMNEDSSASAEGFKSELEEVDTEFASVQDQIKAEKLRLEREAQPFQTGDRVTNRDAIIAENVWQDPFSNQSLIQSENAPATDPLNPILQINEEEK